MLCVHATTFALILDLLLVWELVCNRALIFRDKEISANLKENMSEQVNNVCLWFKAFYDIMSVWKNYCWMNIDYYDFLRYSSEDNP